MQSNFKAALGAVLKSEGGNDDDPSDHGGRTSRGITQREYNTWRKEKGLTLIDVWTAPQEDIEAIYKEEYWDPYCDAFPKGLDYLYFDMAVNAGPHRAALLLQRVLGVTEDGRIGPLTRAALASSDPKTLIARYSNAKEIFYRGLHQPKFLRGWLNRVAEVRQTANSMLA